MNKEKVPIRNRKAFIIGACMLQLVVLLVYGFPGEFYMNDSTHQTTTLPGRSLMYTLNVENMLYGVFMLVGFGLVLVYLKECSWSGLTFSLMAASLSYQFFPLLNSFWASVFLTSFNGQSIKLDPTTTSNGSIKCAVALEVVLCGLIARLSIVQVLVLLAGGVLSFSFCLVINIVVARPRSASPLDEGGSMDIFLWAGVFALTIAYGIRRKLTDLKQKYRATPQNDNPLLALVGTAFLWAGFMFIGHSNPTHQTEMDLVPMNTIFALSASVLTTYMMASWIHYRLGIYQCIMATISGGVIVGSSSSISENPVIALTLGACSGIISYLLIHFTFQRINAKWFVMTHEIFAMFVVNGFFGGVASSVVLASYLGTASERTLYFSRQSGQNTIPTDSSYQIAHIGVTTILALFCGLLVCGLINCFSREDAVFYDDNEYFDEEFTTVEGGWVVDESHQRGGLYRSRADQPIS